MRDEERLRNNEINEIDEIKELITKNCLPKT
jgi:hypothetical protein